MSISNSSGGAGGVDDAGGVNLGQARSKFGGSDAAGGV